jgi:pilus assembly protein CpaB
MNRRARTALVLTVAFATATIATLAMYRIVSAAPAHDDAASQTSIVVARRAVPVGTRLSEEDVKLVAWPSTMPIPGAFASIDLVTGRAVTSSLLENEPIVETRVAPAGAGAGLPPTIEPGMRAISVKVDEVVGVAGFVVPGTRVDVLATVRPAAQEEITRVVVSNATVLTAGTRYDQDDAKNGKPIRTSVVTLMVTPADAERIALAQSRGVIMLTLRNPLDTLATTSDGVRLTNLVGLAEPVHVPVKQVVVRAPVAVAPKPVPVIVEAPKPYTVDTIRAAKRTSEVVK